MEVLQLALKELQVPEQKELAVSEEVGQLALKELQVLQLALKELQALMQLDRLRLDYS